MMLLWIRRVFSTRSAVYAGANWLDKDCIQPAQMLEKKRLVDQGVVFAHPILCISSGLSTAELPSGLFFLAKQGEAVFPLPGRAHSAQRCNAGSLPLADAAPAWPRSRPGLPSPFVPFRQRGQIQVKQDRQDFQQAPTNACSAVVFSAVDSERVFATFCQTFLQQRTRQRLQYCRRGFFAFPPHLRTSSS